MYAVWECSDVAWSNHWLPLVTALVIVSMLWWKPLAEFEGAEELTQRWGDSTTLALLPLQERERPCMYLLDRSLVLVDIWTSILCSKQGFWPLESVFLQACCWPLSSQAFQWFIWSPTRSPKSGTRPPTTLKPLTGRLCQTLERS